MVYNLFSPQSPLEILGTGIDGGWLFIGVAVVYGVMGTLKRLRGSRAAVDTGPAGDGVGRFAGDTGEANEDGDAGAAEESEGAE